MEMRIYQHALDTCTIIIKEILLVNTRGSNGYARIDVRFPDKNDKLVQIR